MRGRLFAAIIVLCIVLMAVWETRRKLSSPVIPPVTPLIAPPAPRPVAHETPPAPASPPIKAPAKRSKKTAVRNKPSNQTRAVAVTPPPPKEAPPPLPVPALPTVPPESQEWKGNNDTAITHSGQIVVQNDHQWVRFWAEHHPHEAAPDVDFSQSMVVGVFLGRRPADGFRVDITGVRTLPDALEVDYIEIAPPPGTFQVAVEAFPYDIKVIPRSALHVKFNQLTAQYQKATP